VIVVDNASADDSIQRVRTLFPHVKVVACQENKGNPEGLNVGARASSGSLLLFCDNDVLLQSDCLERLVSALGGPVPVDIAGPRFYFPNGRWQFDSGKLVPFMVWVGMTSNDERVVDIVGGPVMLIRKKVFDSLSGYDETFFMYSEDIDLLWRAKRRGFRTLFVPQAVAYHVGSFSIGKASTVLRSRIEYLQIINQYKMIFKNASTFLLMLDLVWIQLKAPVEWTVGALAGRSPTVKVNAYRWLVGHLRELLKTMHRAKSFAG
jgi:GT2 family glycosyltransferase